MKLSGQFETCSFFYEKILNPQNAPKRKTNDLHLLRSFCARKKYCLCCLMFAYFCFVSWFWFDAFFYIQNLFVKKKKKKRNKQT